MMSLCMCEELNWSLTGEVSLAVAQSRSDAILSSGVGTQTVRMNGEGNHVVYFTLRVKINERTMVIYFNTSL